MANVSMLLSKHRPLVELLLREFDMAGLVDLAARLPFDPVAARLLLVQTPCGGGASSAGKSLDGFLTWLGHRRQDGRYGRTAEQAAVYVAAAAQGAAGRVLARALELTEEKARLVSGLKDLLLHVNKKKLAPLSEAIKGGAGDREVRALQEESPP